MNILIGKLGRVIFFDKSKWSTYAGDEEGPLLYTMLAKRYPQHTFYLAGRSDIKKYRAKRYKTSWFDDESTTDIGIPDNIVDLFNECPPSKMTYKDVFSEHDVHLWLADHVRERGLRFDAGIMYQGPTGAVGIPNVGIKTLKEHTLAKPLVMFSWYYAPPMHLLNVTNIPYILLVSDPRYVPLEQRDVTNDERAILSQINITKTKPRIVSYEDSLNLRKVKLRYEYAGIETVFLLGEKRVDFRKVKKDKLFVMGLNSGGIQSDRPAIVKSWLLDTERGRDVKIYGAWEDDIVAQYPGRFENKGISEVADEFWRSKYTLIPPFFNKLSGFVTQKFWKMIFYGIVPFFHPMYDTDRIFDVPEVLRVKSPTEMWRNIDRLESNPREYEAVLQHLWEMLNDGYYNGEYLSNRIASALETHAGIKL